MKNLQEYNQFVQKLENNSVGGLSFSYIEEKIVITDHQTHHLLGIWDKAAGKSIGQISLSTRS